MARYIDADLLKADLKESEKRLRELYKGLKFDDEKQICAGQITTFVECILRIKGMPTADVVEVKHGEWKKIECGTICTNCNRVYDNDFEFSYKQINEYFKQCPECGAKMDVSKKEITTERKDT